jgi:hypothetical protein
MAVQVRSFSASDAVAMSALVEVESGQGQRSCYLLAPAFAGTRIPVADTVVLVVGPGSPLGRALLSRHIDDEVVIRSPGGVRELTVLSIC